MPHSLILNFLPTSPIPVGYLSGKHLHALFLTLVSSVDQSLGDRLHEQKTDKAFTLSPLQVSRGNGVDGWMSNRVRTQTDRLNHPQKVIPRRPNASTYPLSHSSTLLQWQHTQSIPAETLCWWRVSLLDDTLFGNLTPLWLNLNPSQAWHLGPANLQITSILGTPQSTQPWVNVSSYAQLYERASHEERQINLLFCTPTTFRQTQFDSALPTRESVFGSLLRRWHQYSSISFNNTILESIFPSFFDIHTELVSDARSKFIGCVGKMSFRILGEVDPLVIKQINTLADFTMYAGVGRKTPMGMGMVRRE